MLALLGGDALSEWEWDEVVPDNVSLVLEPSWVPSASCVLWIELLLPTTCSLPHYAQARPGAREASDHVLKPTAKILSSLQFFSTFHFVCVCIVYTCVSTCAGQSATSGTRSMLATLLLWRQGLLP